MTVDLPTFSRVGDRLSVRVSALGDAKSLSGGTLISTQLKAGDAQTYVVAQGQVSQNSMGVGPTLNPTVAVIPNGGLVEREFSPPLASEGYINLSLKNPDFTNAQRISDAINTSFNGFFADPKNAAHIEVEVPNQFVGKIVDFLAELEQVSIEEDQKSVVVINEKTGTVVMGQDIIVKPVAITHGALSIEVGGPTKQGSGNNSKKQTIVSSEGTNVGKLVETLNLLGVKPNDLVAILSAMHAAGAISSELKFL